VKAVMTCVTMAEPCLAQLKELSQYNRQVEQSLVYKLRSVSEFQPVVKESNRMDGTGMHIAKLHSEEGFYSKR
jgi:hypothetical protein